MSMAKMMSDLRRIAESHLEAGEQIDITTSAMVGQIAMGKMIVQGLAVSALTLGVLSAHSKPRKLFLVATNRRVLFFEGSYATGGPVDKLVLDIPRASLSVVRSKTKRAALVVPTLVVDLAVTGSDTGLTLQFPLPCREDGAKLASSLPAAAA